MNRNSKLKIAVALSGGVDSAVAAKILKDEGHEVIGLFLKLWSDPLCKINGENRCCDYQALEDARSVAAMLDMPFYVINAEKEFKKEVVDYFISEYKALRTPNPCVVCNEKIKFDLLLRKAMAVGCDYLATGHYARIIYDNSGMSKSEFLISNEISDDNKKLQATNYKLKAGVDETKDQSYMLYRLNQRQLSKIIFPLGEMVKKDVRELAKKWNIPLKEKAESQEICFFGDNDYREFLRRYLPAEYFKAGEIVDTDGNIIGRHEGLVNYTMGQRRRVAQETRYKKQDTKPMYVIGFDAKNNRLIVGENKETYRKEMEVSNINWIVKQKDRKIEEQKK